MMGARRPRVAVLVGSVRDGRFGDRVGEWVAARLADRDGDPALEVDLVDLVEVSVPREMGAHPEVAAFAERIDRADAVVVITPEYNHSFPGPLKTALDSVREPWRTKAVGFVSYGGMSGGLRAVEALRLVFAELHAMTIRDGVSLHNPWGPAGDPDVTYPDAAAEEALRRMTDQLLWWADAARAARGRRPYPA